MTDLDADRAAAAGVRFLAAVQRDDGELPSYRYADPALAGDRALDPSPFATTLIADALAARADATAVQVRARALAFVHAEREDPGVWRYWPRRTGRPIDPDLDDTCCAAAALRRAGCDAAADDDAILANRTEHGMFKTWLRDPAAPNDVDSVVNANAVLYLGERTETAPVIDALCRVIAAGAEARTSSYYVDALALHYMVSRAYAAGVTRFGRCRAALLDRLAGRAAGDPRAGFGTALAAALAVAAARNLGATDASWLAPIARRLIATQATDGSWPAAAFYSGPEPPQAPSVWWASEALTTAICVEALTPARAA